MNMLVTGATGFVGANLARHLLEQGHHVKALVRPSSDQRAIAGLDLEIASGDICDQASVARAAEGCELLFHAAALFAINADWQAHYEANVLGTRRVLAGARSAGVRRVVYTSTALAVGSASPGGLAREDAVWDLGELRMPYVTSKYVAEHEALRAVVAGQDVVILNPAAPIGEWDWKPTPTGDTVLRFLRGQIKALPSFLGNFVDVLDVVRGHVLAAERGAAGERYLLTGANLDEKALGLHLAQATGLPAPTLALPTALLHGATTIVESACRLTGFDSPISAGAIAMMRKRLFFDCSKAIAKLGYRPSPIQEAYDRAVAWYREHAYVS